MLKTFQSMLMVAMVFNGVSFEFGDKNFNVERLVILLIFFPSLFLLLTRKKVFSSGATKEFDLAALFYYIWSGIVVASTMLSSSPLAHISGLIISVAPVFIFSIMKNVDVHDKEFSKLNYYLLIYLAFGGVVSFFLASVAPADWNEVFLDRDRLKFTLFESNIFASTAGYFLVIFYPNLKNSRSHWLLVGVCLFAIFLSFSKLPYFALLFSTFLYLYITRSIKAIYVFYLLVLFFIISLSSFIWFDYLFDFYVENLEREDGVNSRMLILNFALQRFFDSFWLGQGPLDFGFYGESILWALGSDNIKDAWIWQMFVSIAHDTGVLGLLFYIAFLFFLVKKSITTLRSSLDKTLAAYFSGFVLILIAGQSTTLHLTGIFGVAAGLLAAACNSFDLRRG